jgi:Trehalose utilisation
MLARRVARPWPAIAMLTTTILLGPGPGPRPGIGAGPVPKLPAGIAREELPKGRDASLAKVVLVAGSAAMKPGEHDYLAGSAALVDLLRQSPGVFPVLAVDWPEKPETFEGARAVVLFLDGGDKHPLVDRTKSDRIRALSDAGAGLVQLHQVADYPIELGDRARALTGAAWEKGYSQRAHWVGHFPEFPDHPICRGVTPFTIDDGWLFKLRFAPGMKGVTPLLRTCAPKNPVVVQDGSEDIVSWAFERPGGGRAFTFTGGHLHKSLAEEGYRRFLVNGILWAAGLDVPSSGAPVALKSGDLDRYLSGVGETK